MILHLVSGVPVLSESPKALGGALPRGFQQLFGEVGALQAGTYSGNLISTYSWGLAFMNRTRSSPACSIMRV